MGKTNKILALCGLLLGILLLASMSPVSASEMSLIVDINYFGNYESSTSLHTPDMTDFVYLGDSNSPFGQTHVEIPLILNGIFQIDTASDFKYSNVPGLNIFRGRDENGTFVYISAAGFNDNLSREQIMADFEFESTEILSAENGLVERSGVRPFDGQGDGECFINMTDPSQSKPNKDEYTFNAGETTGNICSTTSSGEDRVKVYFFTNFTEYECSDGIDNDGDELGDYADPGCHTDNNASNPSTYDPMDDDEKDDEDCKRTKKKNRNTEESVIISTGFNDERRITQTITTTNQSQNELLTLTSIKSSENTNYGLALILLLIGTIILFILVLIAYFLKR
jgi:hypothetical protein